MSAKLWGSGSKYGWTSGNGEMWGSTVGVIFVQEVGAWSDPEEKEDVTWIRRRYIK